MDLSDLASRRLLCLLSHLVGCPVEILSRPFRTAFPQPVRAQQQQQQHRRNTHTTGRWSQTHTTHRRGLKAEPAFCFNTTLAHKHTGTRARRGSRSVQLWELECLPEGHEWQTNRRQNGCSSFSSMWGKKHDKTRNSLPLLFSWESIELHILQGAKSWLENNLHCHLQPAPAPLSLRSLDSMHALVSATWSLAHGGGRFKMRSCQWEKQTPDQKQKQFIILLIHLASHRSVIYGFNL